VCGENGFNKVNICGLLLKTIILQADENIFLSFLFTGILSVIVLQSADATRVFGLARFFRSEL
jgi:hypothetical protein